MKRLVSERGYFDAMSFAVVKEWEDVFCQRLHTGIIKLHFNWFIKAWNRAIFYYIPFTTSKRKWRLAFVFSAGSDRPFRMKNVIPIYVDFHPRVMNKVIKDTRKLPCWFVTSKELCYRVRERSPYNNCFFVPQSVADQWISMTIPEKSMDVIQIGRKNPVLHEWMLKYCEEHVGVEYVYMCDETKHIYQSTLRGVIGTIDGRENFMHTLASAKISLVSTPGKDRSSRRYDESVDFFTARFYESAAARCFLVGRYSENDESKQIGIEKICRQAENYQEFEAAITKCLHADVRTEENEYCEFLKENCTSKRVENVLKVLKDNGFDIQHL